MPEERLQKILSQAGVTSRRQAEKYIVEGRVSVNGTAVTELGSKADLERDHIKVDGRLIHCLLYTSVKALGAMIERAKHRPVYEVDTADVTVAGMILYPVSYTHLEKPGPGCS